MHEIGILEITDIGGDQADHVLARSECLLSYLTIQPIPAMTLRICFYGLGAIDYRSGSLIINEEQLI
jgi:hypothetical protein